MRARRIRITFGMILLLRMAKKKLLRNKNKMFPITKEISDNFVLI